MWLTEAKENQGISKSISLITFVRGVTGYLLYMRVYIINRGSLFALRSLDSSKSPKLIGKFSSQKGKCGRYSNSNYRGWDLVNGQCFFNTPTGGTHNGNTQSEHQLCQWFLALAEQLPNLNQMLLGATGTYYRFFVHVWLQNIATIWCTNSRLDRGNDQTILTTCSMVH